MLDARVPGKLVLDGGYLGAHDVLAVVQHIGDAPVDLFTNDVFGARGRAILSRTLRIPAIFTNIL